MAKKDPNVDRFIREAAPFARPILKRIRSLVHRGCPQAEETIKWGMPFFMVDGKILCAVGAFKAHCNFGFWKGRSILAADGSRAKVGMGQRYGRITAVGELPSAKELSMYIKQGIELNAKVGQAKRPATKSAKPALRMPPDFARALRATPKANRMFADFSPSKKKEYVEWIVDAKTEETRERRMETAVEWIAQGKSRNWKYQS
jgi:uncharacterized protein YdeI (YjbR/CyaY-like superfamily)